MPHAASRHSLRPSPRRDPKELKIENFVTDTGLVAPLDCENVDTDMIIPKQFLKSIKRTGFGPNAFDHLRYLDDGQPDQDNSKRPLNPDFVLNKPRYRGASILLARKNFGTGSSREHAPWALQQIGLRALIAPSFADIFYSNCLKIGLLPIVLTEQDVDQLFREAEAVEGYQLTVDLGAQIVRTPEGDDYKFEISAFRKKCLMDGLDETGLALGYADEIRKSEAQRLMEQPWLDNIAH
jgi:3-isopropylmalate/(R)-2-methylmalate dehydratase small subunit